VFHFVQVGALYALEHPGYISKTLGGNESYPDLFQPFGGFPDGVRVENGFITMPGLPGIGFEGKPDLIRVMRELSA
jgi:D(-)-tartrate dehydratase